VSFTYDFTNAPDISTVRLLVSDTDSSQPIFQDDEVNAALNMFSSQGIIIGLTGYCLAVPVKQLYSYRRAAAVLLNALAGNKARLGAIVGLLDVKLNAAQASAALKELAQSYIDQEQNDGYFAISEMVQDSFSMRERLWKMLYRTNNT
jgi:hypothetical protein